MGTNTLTVLKSTVLMLNCAH